MEITVPFFDTTLDTSDPAQSGVRFVVMALGGFVLFAAVAVASWMYSRAKNAAGIDNSPEIPVA